MSNILFSTIGMTDPIRGEYDGPFLHILRHYNFKKAYLFMSSEVYKYHLHDNRYIIIGQRVSEKTEFRVLDDHTGLNDPSNFSESYKILKSAFNKVLCEHPQDDVYVNISSGTPQLVSVAFLLAAVDKRNLHCIQVVTPSKKSNKTEPVQLDYDYEKAWENNLDNLSDEEIENRCREISPVSVRKEITSEIIKSHIDHYDYEAAYRVASDNETFISEKTIYLIEAAKYRYNLFYSKAKYIGKEVGIGYCVEELEEKVRNIFEHFLRLELKCKKNQIQDFALSISPILMEIAYEYLKVKHKADMHDFCDFIKKKEAYKLKGYKMSSQLKNHYDKSFEGNFRDGYLSFSNILPGITYYSNNETDIRKFNELRIFEENIRNKTAHDLIALDKDELKQKFGFSPEGILSHLKYFIICIYGSKKQFEWDAYDRINEEIIESID